jgi:hypothetical protein
MDYHSVLIIAGTHKSGTTSLFSYLGEHPDICPAYIKQTNFFLDEGFRAANPKLTKTFKKDGKEAFTSFFRGCSEKDILMDATPDYLYSINALKRISEFSKTVDTSVVFILRNPVDRFISWFNYGKQIGEVSANMSINDFLDNQISDFNQHICWNALETGNYTQYLKPWYDTFDESKIIILYFEELKSTPQTLLERLCNRIDIESQFYSDFSFKINNKSVTINNNIINKLYVRTRSKVLSVLTKHTELHAKLFPILQYIAKKSRLVNHRGSINNSLSKDDLSDELIQYLNEYYQSEKKSIFELTNIQPNWK